MYEFDSRFEKIEGKERGFRALLGSFIERPWYSRLVLSFIFINDILDYKTLMETVGTSYSSISKMLNSLVKDGIIVRERGIKKYYFCLTEKGHELVKHLLERIDKLIEVEVIEVEERSRGLYGVRESNVKYVRVINPERISVFAPKFDSSPLLKRLGYKYNKELGWVRRLGKELKS